MSKTSAAVGDTIAQNEKVTKEIAENLASLLSGGKVSQSKFDNVDIKREGSEIILPEGMTYDTAINWLHKKRDNEEKIVAVNHDIDCFPLEGALAFKRAIDRIYGFAQLRDKVSFFGSQPPHVVSVEIAPGEFEDVPWGMVEPTGFEGGYLETRMTNANGKPKFVVNGEVKRKFEGAVAEIVALTKKILKEESIYKGKAIRVNLEYIRSGRGFNIDDAPKFLDLTKISENDLILKDTTRLSLATSMFLRIEQTEACKAKGIPLKHGVLLMGPYGTGKTLTAKVTALKATEHDWTFIYLEDCMDLADALRMAEQYAPAVVFAEDIDKAVEGEERSTSINKILNTLDGIDTKNKPIITCLTTNHPENINKAFLRAGRIDTAIYVAGLDSDAAIEFVKKYMVDDQGDPLMEEKPDYKKIGKTLDGLVPAFIAEIINKAKMYAIYREGKDIKGKVSTDDIIQAADALKDHVEMVKMYDDKGKKMVKVSEALKVMNDELGGGDDMKTVKSQVDNIEEVVHNIDDKL